MREWFGLKESVGDEPFFYSELLEDYLWVLRHEMEPWLTPPSYRANVLAVALVLNRPLFLAAFAFVAARHAQERPEAVVNRLHLELGRAHFRGLGIRGTDGASLTD